VRVATHNDAPHVGARGESFFADHFIEERIFISQPLYDLWGADFVVEWKGSLCKVNVKAMHWDRSVNSYKASLVRGNKGVRRSYTDAEINYFGVVNLYYKRIWMVPLEVVNTRTNLNYKGPMETRKKIQGRTFDWEKYRVK